MTSKKPGFTSSFTDEEFEGEEEFAQGGIPSADSAESSDSKDDFASMLADSFKKTSKKLSVGDRIEGEFLVIGKEDCFVSLGGRGGGAGGNVNDGIVSRRDLINEAGEVPYKVGDRIKLYVTQVRASEIHLSPNKTSKNMSDDLQDAYENRLTVEGRVVEMCKGGVRVSIHGKLAFCPISQLDSNRTETGEEFIGKKLEFRITQLSEGGRNIVVSRRKLLDEQRVAGTGSFLAEHKAGDVVNGKVARLETFGAFIELAPGIDGLAHISELSWSRVAEASEAVTVGQEVRVKILKIENPPDGRTRISLSIKQASDAQPWDNPSTELQAGKVVTGKVVKCMPFGAFVEIAPGIDGLVPLGEMSYTKRVMKSDELFKEGDQIEVMIKDINPETRKILLSYKDGVGQDPWSLVATKFPVGTILSGLVERREAYGIFVKLEEGLVGLLPKSKANETPEFPYEKLKVGDAAVVQVAEIRRDERRISLQPPKDPGSDDWKAFEGAKAAASGLGTLGGAFGDALKKAMDKKSAK